MRWVAKICLLVLAPGLVLAQTTAQNTPSDPTSVAAELKALREAMAQQQQQIAQQQQRIDALQKALEAKTSGTPHVEDATLHTNAPAEKNVAGSDMQEQAKESPLSFRIGNADFTPGGFVDFENIFRTTNTGNAATTNFGQIPFSNTVPGHLTEFRITGQYSRLNLRVNTKFGANNVIGYVEGDFNGNDPANIFVSTNSHTARLRLYWLDLKRGKWEFLGGQSWGLMTPNRVGLSPMPADLALGLGEDANVHVGINYTRAGTFRAVWHPSDNLAWGVGVENAQQYLGTNTGDGNSVIFPTAFNAQLSNQFDSSTGNSATPNVGPDVNTKLAFDGNAGGKHYHFEVGGTLTTVKITSLPQGVPFIPGATFGSHSKTGGGIQGAFNFELVRNFRILANGMWGNGIGRYLIGLAPDAVLAPITVPGGVTCNSVLNPGPPPFVQLIGNCDVRPSLVHSGNGTAGVEFQLNPKTQFGAYYGAMYAQRNFFPDLTTANAAGFHPNIGFGFPPVVAGGITQFGGSNRSGSRAIQQGTFDWNQTFWRNPQYGAVVLIAQYSYLTRSPWFVAAGGPKNAHLSMVYLSLRYVLP